MAATRPFASADDLLAAADRVWTAADPTDWLEAFAAHPKIGAGQAGRAERPEGTEEAEWAAQEQSGARVAPDDVRERLARGNRDYEARFGYIFIVCATGKSADEMLAALEHRLRNAPDVEIGIAADEQRRITRLRLLKLLSDERKAHT